MFVRDMVSSGIDENFVLNKFNRSDKTLTTLILSVEKLNLV